MKCPVCGSSKNKVVDTVKTYIRDAKKKGYILTRLVRALRMKDTGELAREGGVGRHRHCQHCNTHFITHETMAQIMRAKQ
tara:strand:+ start:251 stop:490 length:240 start_codon:yes stop_codon:yes gene_type:complete